MTKVLTIGFLVVWLLSPILIGLANRRATLRLVAELGRIAAALEKR